MNMKMEEQAKKQICLEELTQKLEKIENEIPVDNSVQEWIEEIERGEYSTLCTTFFDILSFSAFVQYFTEHFCGTFKVLNALKFRTVPVFFY